VGVQPLTFNDRVRRLFRELRNDQHDIWRTIGNGERWMRSLSRSFDHPNIVYA
jgi:hypothetical protein